MILVQRRQYYTVRHVWYDRASWTIWMRVFLRACVCELCMSECAFDVYVRVQFL